MDEQYLAPVTSERAFRKTASIGLQKHPQVSGWPRAQSRGTSTVLKRGCALVFTTRDRPVASGRGRPGPGGGSRERRPNPVVGPGRPDVRLAESGERA